ncbi:MAG: GNAT family N-acetyltransferase [Alphaproteobacteria bacterium]|nr:GNAT family N-acetyltransferase [Alphaproteobacteria bacterium]
MKTPVLETERLILRPVTLADAPSIQKHFNQWEIIKHLSTLVPWPYPEDGAEQFLFGNALPRMEKGEALVWAIISKTGPDEAIGLIDFRLLEGKTGDRGFWLTLAFQGRGLMTEAITATQDFIFFTAGIKKFTVKNAKTNIASRRVKEKTGAHFVGMEKLEHNSGETDSESWEVTKEGWEAIRKANT